MGKKELERIRKKMYKLEKNLSEYTEKFNKDFKDAMDILDAELKVESGSSKRKKNSF